MALGAFAAVSPVLVPAAAGAGLIVLVIGVAAAALFGLVALALFISGTSDRIRSDREPPDVFDMMNPKPEDDEVFKNAKKLIEGFRSELPENNA